MRKQVYLCFLLPFALLSCRPVEKATPASRPEARARLAVTPDGFFQANVSTAVGQFKRSVLVRDGRIDCVQVGNAHCMPFVGDLVNGESSGVLQNGDMARIELESVAAAE